MECTEHRIAFMCCTKNCTCHDPVTTKLTPSPTPPHTLASILEAANDAKIGRTSSSDTTAITAGVAAASGVGVLALVYVQFRRRSHRANAADAGTAADAVQQASEVTGGAPVRRKLTKQASVQEV